MGALGKLNKGVRKNAALQQQNQVSSDEGMQEQKIASGAIAISNGENIDPKTKKAMSDYQTLIMKILHSPETRKSVMDMLSSAPPEQSIPFVALKVNKMTEDAVTQKTGKPPSTKLKLAGAAYLISDLIDMGNISGLFEIPKEDSVKYLQETMKQYIHQGLSDGSIDPVELQRDTEPLLNDQQRKIGLQISQELGQPNKPTAQMGINKAVDDKAKPLEKENTMLKGQLKMQQRLLETPQQPQGE